MDEIKQRESKSPPIRGELRTVDHSGQGSQFPRSGPITLRQEQIAAVAIRELRTIGRPSRIGGQDSPDSSRRTTQDGNPPQPAWKLSGVGEVFNRKQVVAVR